MKAYSVQDADRETGCVVFAVGNVQARRIGASRLDAEFGEVECRRAPEFDHHAPGPVPDRVLYDAGWHFDCGHCGARVQKDEVHEGRSDHEGNDADPGDYGFVGRRGWVFCCEACAGLHDAEFLGMEECELAVIEAAMTRFPYALSASAFRDSRGWRASIRFDGVRHSVTWAIGDAHVMVSQCDAEDFTRLYGVNSAEPKAH